MVYLRSSPSPAAYILAAAAFGFWPDANAEAEEPVGVMIRPSSLRAV